MTASLPRLTPYSLGRRTLLAALAAGCSPAGNAPALGPQGLPRVSDTAASASGTTRYFGDEFADQQRALRSRPDEPVVATY